MQFIQTHTPFLFTINSYFINAIDLNSVACSNNYTGLKILFFINALFDTLEDGEKELTDRQLHKLSCLLDDEQKLKSLAITGLGMKKHQV